MSLPLPISRLLMFAMIVAGVVLGLSLTEHSHKVLASVSSGVVVGWLWRSVWRSAKRNEPELLAQAQRNAVEAQKILQEHYAWKWGSGPRAPNPTSTSVEEVLSDAIAIVLTISLGLVAWVLPAFEQYPLSGLSALAEAVGVHVFALCCIGTATFGVLTRMARKAGEAL